MRTVGQVLESVYVPPPLSTLFLNKVIVNFCVKWLQKNLPQREVVPLALCRGVRHAFAAGMSLQ